MAGTYQLDPTNQLGQTINGWQSHAQTVIAPATANTQNLIASRKDTLILCQNQYCRGLSANACATQMLQNEATAKAIKELAYMAFMMSPLSVVDSAKTVVTGTDLSGEDSSRLLAVLGVLDVNAIKAISHAVAETGGLLKAAKAAVSDSPETKQLTKELEDVNRAGGVATKGAFDFANDTDGFIDDVVAFNRTTDGGGNLFSGNLASIMQSASYYDTPAEQGAAIFRSIIKNHTFENGNKRTAVAAYRNFAERTGLPVNLSDSQLFDLTLRVERGDLIDVSEIANALR